MKYKIASHILTEKYKPTLQYNIEYLIKMLLQLLISKINAELLKTAEKKILINQ